MQKIGYFLFRIVIFNFKLIPFFLLYLYADFLYFVLYYIIGYRRKIIKQNLKASFPEKSEAELEKIEKKYYKNVADITLESIKGMSMSKSRLIKRYKVLNPEIFDEYFEKGQSIIAVGSHYANWEWGALCFCLQFKHTSVGVYKPLSNKPIDSYIRKTRSSWGMNLESILETGKTFSKYSKIKTMYYLVTDQSPSNSYKSHWVNFLNQYTACLHGASFYSKKYNYPIVFGDVQRVKRGFYEITMSILVENPENEIDIDITRKIMQKIESVIVKKPEDWLWSHNRWKHKKPVTENLNISS